MKVAVIGGGSTYTPELVAGFLARQENLPLELCWSSRCRLALVSNSRQ